MKFVMEKNQDESHRVTINILKETINNSLQKEFIKLSKTKIINGFRKGKIPITFIQKKYGDVVYYDIFKQLMQKFFYEFLNKEKIKIIGSPQYYIHNNKNEKKEYVQYSVIYEIYPTFQIKNINNITVNKINVQITDEEIQNNIEKYKYKNFFWKKINKPIKSNNRVTIDYEVYNNIHLITKFNKKNYTFIVSDTTLIPQLKYKIINHVINDIIFFTIKFHALYPIQELQNQNITFKIKITKIEEQEEIETDSNTIKNIYEQKLNQKQYKNIKNNIYAQIQKITEKYLEDQIIDQIIKKNIILIPPILFKQNKKNLHKEYVKQYHEKNSNILEKKYHYNFDIKVKKQLCMQIILDTILSNEKIFVDEKNLTSLINKISLNYKKPTEIINLYNKNETFKNTIKNIELKNQAIKFLKNNVNIVEKYWTFNDFINYEWETYNEFAT
ncbi:trigger factor [Buchnera aphidicola]|uniref:Trigger factor n=1 Tax=Buchnera aphidicola str. Ua (Uroleucon ambrosiae) TaxID=1005057 RepID=G2LPW0_BUCUM|nr:trigger factor [Buchnera aphidicola]AEO08247.1 trigger factor [Buchnera aphidicola str. Ua (Uroleucon ambrosiae)]